MALRRLKGWLKALKTDTKIFFKVRNNTVVLMYHRVVDGPLDPWQLAVSPKNFLGQLKFLKSTGLVVSMDQFKRNLESGNSLPPSILITFDDGYLDNFLHAKPLLEKYDLPATFFICSKHIGTKKEFWWDELAHVILETKVLPPIFEMELNGQKVYANLGISANATPSLILENRSWEWTMKPTNPRIELYLRIWEILSPLGYDYQQTLMDKIRDWASVSAHLKPENYCMSEGQLLELSQNRLFTIGGHTDSHPMLPCFPREVQREELKANKEYLESLTNKNIHTFAYPSGKHDDVTAAEVGSLGFDLAFTTISRRVEVGVDKLRIPRKQVVDLNKASFQKAIGKWLI